MILQCPICSETFECTPNRFNKSKTGIICCSVNCSIRAKVEANKNCICDNCGVKFHKKPSSITKYNYCSVKCLGEHRSSIYKGKNNPNSFCRIEKYNRRLHCGYYWLFLPEHPLSTKDGYIREHRLIAERFLLTEETSIVINGELFLNPNYEVHHKDFNKLNNNPENLQLLTSSEHTKLHWEIRNEKLRRLEKIENK